MSSSIGNSPSVYMEWFEYLQTNAENITSLVEVKGIWLLVIVSLCSLSSRVQHLLTKLQFKNQWVTSQWFDSVWILSMKIILKLFCPGVAVQQNNTSQF